MKRGAECGGNAQERADACNCNDMHEERERGREMRVMCETISGGEVIGQHVLDWMGQRREVEEERRDGNESVGRVQIAAYRASREMEAAKKCV